MSKRKQSTPRQFQNGSDPRLATGSSAGGEDNSAALMESEDHNESEADMTDSVSTTATPATGDIHVCGSCQAEFKSLERFLRHKEACVRSTSQDDVIALSPSEMPASSNGPVGTCETPLSVQSMFSEIQKQHMALLQMLQKLLMKIGDSRTGICMHGRNGTVANLDLLTSPESGIGSGTEGDGSSRRDFVCPVERQCFSDLKSFLDHLQHHQKMQASSSDGPRLGRKYDETSIMNANKISTSDKQKSSLSAEIVCANSPYSDAEERIDNGEEDGMDDGESDDGKGGDMTPVGPDGQPLDPASYMALLPTPGSNDSSWEQLMEIAAPIETTRLREMVDRIDDKRDPHECGICKRVLSCKSALQMHYRTHTGERPFRCKLCRRAFTTKGNLKTHMGVHRTKLVGATNSISIPSEMPNLMALQQRLMEQNHLLSDGPGNSGALPSLFGSASVHDFRSHAASLRSDWPLQAPSTQTSFQSLEALIQRTTGGHSAGNNNFEERLPMDLSASQNGNGRSENDDNDSQSIKSEDENDADDTRESLNFREIDGTSQNAMASPENGMALDLTPRSNSVTRISPDGEMLNGTRLTSPRNTTCHVCYKTFACQSALQIHFRSHISSHTKERPFTCPICKRGFSTKGNMKQHLLTHKIRELPPHSQHSSHSVGSPMEECSQPSEDAKPLLESTGSTASSVKHQQQDDDSNSIISKDNNNNNAALLPANTAAGLSGTGGSGSINGAASQRRSGYAKNVCHVCDKPFSSNSALQIHMRTHTGEKPFVCDKCGRAFTTKGNLKVHMGTHMWNDTSSTLRRRNSSADPDLPLPKRHASDRDSSSSQPLPHPMNPSSLSASAGMNPINSFYPGMSNFNEMQRKLLDSYSASVGLQSSPMFFPYAAMFNGMVGKMGLTNPAAANLYAAQAAISGLGPNGYFGMNSAMPGFDMAAMGKRIHDAQSGDSAGSRSPRSSDTPESRQSNESGETVPVRSGGRESSGAVTVPK